MKYSTHMDYFLLGIVCAGNKILFIKSTYLWNMSKTEKLSINKLPQIYCLEKS